MSHPPPDTIHPSFAETEKDTALRPQITFVIPALNEEDIIERVVGEIVEVVQKQTPNYEIILVNDGSIDRTGALMDAMAKRNPRIASLHNSTNIGLGKSYKAGLAAAKGEYLMMLCGDGGFPAASLPPVLREIGSADIIVPYMQNLKRIKTPARYVLSRCYTTLLNLLFHQDIRYYNGLPVHKTANLRAIEITSSGFGFQAEILTKLLRAGHRYKQIGVLGAEETQRSKALRLRNIVSVAKTLATLVTEILRYRPTTKPGR